MKHLEPKEIEFLLETLTLPEQLRRFLEQRRESRTAITDSIADELRDLCGERLQTHGFGSNYEVTPEGERLEQLIDRLFIG